MSVSRTSAFEQVPPRRPGTSDVINGAKTNATTTVPPNMASAEEFEQMAALLVAYGRMVPTLRFSITYTGSTPSLQHFASIRTDAVMGDFTVVDGGAGDIEIRWASSKYPASNSGPMVTINNSGGPSACRAPDAFMTAPSSGVTGVHVVIKDSAGGAIDMPFTVEVF